LDWNFSGFFLSKRAAEKGGMGDRALPIRTSEPSTRNSKCSKYHTRKTAIFDKKFVFFPPQAFADLISSVFMRKFSVKVR
jgi:hypothetical protein